MLKEPIINGDTLLYNHFADAEAYFCFKGYAFESLTKAIKDGSYDIISQVIGIQFGIYLISKTKSKLLIYEEILESLETLKNNLIKELKEKYDLKYDEYFLETCEVTWQTWKACK